MSNTTRSARTGILVGITSTLLTGVIVSIAVAGAAGDQSVDALRPAVVVEAAPSGSTVPRVTPVMDQVRIEPPAIATIVIPELPVVEATVPVVAQDMPGVDVPERPPVEVDRLVLVGDSLADEASSVVRYLTSDKVMVPRYMGGTAPCDWLDRDLEATPTTVVVITFTGNNHRDCMLDATGVPMVDEELVEKYRGDVGVLIERATAAGAWVVLVGQPRHVPVLDADVEIEGLNAAYREFADTLPRVSFVDAGHAVETPDGQYTDRLRCAEHDTDCAPDGTTVVRGDGVHFCPVVQVNPCPVWSSGAVRFGGAIAAAVNDPAAFD